MMYISNVFETQILNRFWPRSCRWRAAAAPLPQLRVPALPPRRRPRWQRTCLLDRSVGAPHGLSLAPDEPVQRWRQLVAHIGMEFAGVIRECVRNIEHIHFVQQNTICWNRILAFVPCWTNLFEQNTNLSNYGQSICVCPTDLSHFCWTKYNLSDIFLCFVQQMFLFAQICPIFILFEQICPLLFTS